MLTLRSFVVGDDGPSSDRIQLGSVADGGRRRICRDDGSELVIGPNDAPMLDLDPTMLRDPNLLDVPFEAIIEVRIETPSGRRRLRVDQHGGFGLVEPGLGPPDAAAIETLRDRLAHLHAERWLAPSDRRTASARAPNAFVDFIVSNARPDDADREHAQPPQPIHHRLRLLLDDAGQSVGWFDEDPTPFRIDAAFVKLINELSHDQRGKKHRIDLPRR